MGHHQCYEYKQDNFDVTMMLVDGLKEAADHRPWQCDLSWLVHISSVSLTHTHTHTQIPERNREMYTQRNEEYKGDREF